MEQKRQHGKAWAARSLLTTLALMLALVVGFLPATAKAADPVAKIGDTPYATLDEAVKAAADGDTIAVLQDCTTEGLNLSKNLTIAGAVEGATPTITFNKDGIALWGKSLTFENCNVSMIGIGSTPYAEWRWMAICASKDASLTLDNASMTLDGADTGNNHAIYFCSNNKLNIQNESTLTIKNYAQDALEWDGGDGGYNVNITNGSTFVSDHNRSGFTGTFYATIDNSTVSVVNSTGNGSNGSHFIIKNNSIVDFSSNGSHGLSTGVLDVDDSTITANNNGMNGIVFNNKATFDNANVTITGSKGVSYWNAGMRALTASASCAIGADCVFSITDNDATGIFLDANTSLSIEEGADVIVTRNHAEQANCSDKKDLAQSGGGIVVRSGATATLSASTKLYNNHASIAGDDIYVEKDGTITFNDTQDDWHLDGAKDGIGCSDAITGWYNDSRYLRWNAHTAPTHTNVYAAFGGGAATETGVLALKAAHGLEPVVPNPVPELDVSKSKVATNLVKGSDGAYTSDITLSLPSEAKKSLIAVAFVLDGSTSTDQSELASQAAILLDELAALKNVDVQVSLTIFGGSLPLLESTDLKSISDDNHLAALKTMLTDPSYDKKEGRSGSNLQAGVEDARAKLNDSSVDEANRYMVVLSDGAARMWYQDGAAMSQAYESNGEVWWNSNSDWIDYRYAGSKTHPVFTDVWTAGQNGTNIGAYGMTEAQAKNAKVGDAGVANTETVMAGDYYTTYEAATYNAATSLVDAAQESNVMFVSYPYHYDQSFGQYIKSFLNWVGTLDNVTLYEASEAATGDEAAQIFSNVKDEMIQLVGAGSTIEDVIGFGADDHGSEYDFDFVQGSDALVLTVGAAALDVTVDPANASHYFFGTANTDGVYPYELTYTPGDKGAEKFVFKTNVSITKDNQVQLTYRVKLTNPQTTAGTYGAFDADGSQGRAGLYTNASATLYPVDSTGEQGAAQEFGKPTVSYTVEEPMKPTKPTKPSKPADATKLPSTGDNTPAPVALASVAVLGIAVTVGGVMLRRSRLN